ncbi:MAG TPA: hypothetical protein VG815_07575, partial [Chloroflexota bacterium]|nr:hypothetical protein [Chloroflexota bacterium]
MALRVKQLAEVLGPSLEDFWAADGAGDQRVSCVTHALRPSDLLECQAGELVILAESAAQSLVDDTIEAWLDRDPAAALVSAGSRGPAETEDLRRRANERGCALGILSAGVEPGEIALRLSRAQAAVHEEPAAPELRSEDTLQGLAETLGRLVGNSVTIETPSHDLLASSPTGGDVDKDRVETILHRRAAARIMEHEDFKHFFARVRVSDRPLHMGARPDFDFSGRVAVRVAADGDLLGVIWVTDTARPLRDVDYRTIRQAADVAAVIITRQRLGARREAHLRAELLDEV